MIQAIAKERVARMARLCPDSKQAGGSLGITKQAFVRLCRQHKIETPWQRKLREVKEAKDVGP
jgi:hypothetical protein